MSILSCELPVFTIYTIENKTLVLVEDDVSDVALLRILECVDEIVKCRIRLSHKKVHEALDLFPIRREAVHLDVVDVVSRQYEFGFEVRQDRPRFHAAADNAQSST